MKTAFSAFVFGSYERFIPFYILSIHKNYPESDIILFYHTTLSKQVKKYIEKFKQVTIYEDFFAEVKWVKDYKIKGGGGAKSLLRFLISKEYFNEFDYVYFGDVDILIMKEEESLFQLHKKQLQINDVPFSNKLRKLPNGNLSKRLTGLHFIEVEPYYEKIEPIIDKIMWDNDFRNNFLMNISRDEELLYKISKLAFKFDRALIAKNIRPWHGFHIGLVRGKNFLNLQAIKENSSLPYEEIRDQLTKFLSDQLFIKALKEIHCSELYYTFVYFGISLPMSIHVQYNLDRIREKLKKKLIRIGKFLLR